MITFGASGALDAKARLIRDWGVGRLHLETQREHWKGQPAGHPDTEADRSILTQESLRAAKTYWVSPEMCDMVDAAARTLPGDVQLLPELLPAPTGLAFFAGRIGAETAAGVDVPLAALHWRVSPMRDGATFEVMTTIAIDAYTPFEEYEFLWMGRCHWDIGGLISQTDGGGESGARRLLALAALLSSPGVTDVERPTLDRSTVRRAERSKVEPEVNVIYLRGSSPSQGDGSGEGRYHHRWIVSGHWRSQPYGPGRSLRRPVWVRPHVKGPDGAPMLAGERVWAVTH